MLIDHIPLSWYTDKICNQKHFSLIKYSDAALYCMQGKEGGDCNGCDYTPSLKSHLRSTLMRNSSTFFHGCQRMTDRDNEAMTVLTDRMLLKTPFTWIDTGIIASSFIDGKLFPLIEALRKVSKLVIISNAKIRPISAVVPYHHFIEVPESNALNALDHVIKSIKELTPAVFLFSCGMASIAFINALHGLNVNNTLIDIGHIWDPFLGIKSRHYMKDLTEAHAQRNLRP